MTNSVKFSPIRIAFLFPDSLTPLNSGAKVNSGNILEHLRARDLHVTLISIFMHDPNSGAVKNYCDHLLEIPSLLRAPWWRVLNKISNTGCKHAFSRDFLFRRLMRKRVWQALRSMHFDAIILNYVQFSEWIPPDLKSKTILFTHDIYHRRWASLSNIPLDCPTVAVIKKIEYQELAKYPLLLTVADYETDILSQDFPINQLLDIGAPQVVRICHKDEPVYRFGFVGANAPQNSDGLIYFLQEWCALLENGSFGVAGSVCSNPEVSREVNAVGGKLEGYVENIDDFYMNCLWIIAPLLKGSGVKIKVLEAMARGKVVIGTSKAFEGIPVTHGINALILENFETPSMLAKTIQSIEKTPGKLEQMQKRSSELIQKHYSLESRINPLMERIKRGPPFEGPSL